MKALNQYIQESILDDDEDIDNKTLLVQPKTKDELIDIIIKSLKEGETDLNFIDVSKIIDMSYLFYAVNKYVTVKDIDISEWNVSNVKIMHSMFITCNNFNSDLNKWDVSNVTNMAYIFYKCENFNSDLSKWDVSNVENMNGMFEFCKVFKGTGLSKWDVSNLKTSQSMFRYCIEFNENLNDWNVSKLRNAKLMFDNCIKFDKPLNKWNLTDLLYATNMFFNCQKFNQDISNWNLHIRTRARINHIFDDCPIDKKNKCKIILYSGKEYIP